MVELKADTPGGSVRVVVVDWWDRIYEKSWTENLQHPAVKLYLARTNALSHTGPIPPDEEVLYGRVTTGGNMIFHFSEVGRVFPAVTPPRGPSAHYDPDVVVEGKPLTISTRTPDVVTTDPPSPQEGSHIPLVADLPVHAPRQWELIGVAWFAPAASPPTTRILDTPTQNQLKDGERVVVIELTPEIRIKLGL